MGHEVTHQSLSTVKNFIVFLSFYSLFSSAEFERRCCPFFQLYSASKYGINILIAFESLSFIWQGAVDAFMLVSSFHCGKKKTQQRCSVWCFSHWGTCFYKRHSQLEADDVEGAITMIWENWKGAHISFKRCAATNIHSDFKNTAYQKCFLKGGFRAFAVLHKFMNQAGTWFYRIQRTPNLMNW